MNKYFELLYWTLMVVVMGLILMSFTGSFISAIFLSLMLMPGILLAKYLLRDLSFKNRSKGILNTIYLIFAILLVEYLAIILFYYFSYGFEIPENVEILLNPVLIWFMLAAMLSIETLLKARLFPSEPEAEYITFTSDRKKISLKLDDITYIESRDYEVEVMTESGESYPTRMKISQWEAVLDKRFIRVHRAFIVNRRHITRFDQQRIYIKDFPIDISRKYKDAVRGE